MTGILFLQDRDSFLLESFNSLVNRLGFVVKIFSLVHSTSHLSEVQLHVDYPENHTALLVGSHGYILLLLLGGAWQYKDFYISGLGDI